MCTGITKCRTLRGFVEFCGESKDFCEVLLYSKANKEQHVLALVS